MFVVYVGFFSGLLGVAAGALIAWVAMSWRDIHRRLAELERKAEAAEKSRGALAFDSLADMQGRMVGVGVLQGLSVRDGFDALMRADPLRGEYTLAELNRHYGKSKRKER